MSDFLRKTAHKIYNKIASQNLFIPDFSQKYTFTVGNKHPADIDETNQSIKHCKETALSDRLRAMNQELEREK